MSQSFKESEIRPKELYDNFLNIVRDEVIERFENTKRIKRECPACEKVNDDIVFSRLTFSYTECPVCRTIYVNPIPQRESLQEYYTDSRALDFFANKLYAVTEGVRRAKIFKPRAEMVKSLLDTHGIGDHRVFDIGGGTGLLADELSLLGIECEIIEPSVKQADICRKKGIKVHNQFFEGFDLRRQKGHKILTSFELIEHLLEPVEFFKHAYKGMRRGDYFLFTTLSSMGLDLRVLWEKSVTFLPPLHLVFFNPASIRILVEKIGFEIISLETPGELDVDILCNNRSKIEDRFWRMFVDSANDSQKASLQCWLKENGLSSHMRVLLRKADNN